jgi:CBS domain-containing protein
MQPVTGATPLFALPIVALDLETTGLNVEVARIVQIGARKISMPAPNEGEAFNRQVNPGVPIPANSVAIHGITDAMAVAAEPLPAIWPALLAFVQGNVMVGHTLAYDLTVLEREAARHHLPWQRPRSLCVRRLAPIAIPTLHDPSLDKLAAWLDIEIDGRHSALGDAEAAGRIFLRMVPLLAEQGIRSLAQAERAILARSPQALQERDAGWISPVASPGADAVLADVKRYDTYAYRHLVGDVMARPAVVVGAKATLLEAMRVMAERGISSVLVAEPPEASGPIEDYAILTERDALRQIAQSGGAALSQAAAAMASRPVRSIREKAYVYRAIARMRRLKVRHLAVLDEAGEVSGMISARDLLKSRSEPAIALSDAIKEAQSANDMAVAWSSLATVVRSLTQEGLDAHTVTRIVSEELRAMTERAADLAALAMERDGKGAAPCAFAVMVLGSGGRGESLLKPDQDNAIVYAAGDPDGPEDRWFAAFAEHMADYLDEAGIPYCTGGVMARNAIWRGSVETWRGRIAAWVANPNPQSLLNVDIFFDQIAVRGARRLAHDLFAYAYEIGSQNPIFAKLLGGKLEQIANPFGFLGRLSGENGQLDLKLHALFPIVSAARVLAIRHNVAARATRDRLERLSEMGRGDSALLLALIKDHEFCLSLLLRSQSRALLYGEQLGNHIDLGRLRHPELAQLRNALKRIQLTGDMVRDLMF